MSVDALTVLDWTYKPKDFFEVVYKLSFAGGTIELTSGHAKGRFESSYYAESRSFRTKAHEYLRDIFLIQQVKVHKHFVLSEANMTLEHADGRINVTMFAEGVHFRMKSGTVDMIARDAKGNITCDTEAERIKNHENFRAAVAPLLTADPILRRMLESFQNALADKQNMLVHLYEIRDALLAEFESEPIARAAVNVTANEWREFGKMANRSPILEGRHRGEHSHLRAATQDEIIQSLKFCQKLIEGYVGYRSANDRP